VSALVYHYRPVWEGGQYEGDESKRQDALRLAMQLGAHYIDVELEVITNQLLSPEVTRKTCKYSMMSQLRSNHSHTVHYVI